MFLAAGQWVIGTHVFFKLRLGFYEGHANEIQGGMIAEEKVSLHLMIAWSQNAKAANSLFLTQAMWISGST